MKNTESTELPTLEALCQSQTPVSIYLRNGVRLIGKIAAYDEHTILLRSQTDQMIYKQAIATVMKQRENVGSEVI